MSGSIPLGNGKILATKAILPRDLFRGKYRSKWNFWKHGITSSFLYSFLTCREQTRLSYVEGWSSRTTPLAFEFGTCNHYVFEQAYDLDKRKKLKHPTKTDIEVWMNAYEKTWQKLTPNPTPRQIEQQELVYGMAEAILPHYFTRWDGDFNGGKYTYKNNTSAPVEWISLEEVFKFEYEFPDGMKVPMRGRRDGVFKDKRGKMWVFDTKCRSVINHEDALDTLPMDTQQMLYLYVTALEHGSYPTGTVMNIVRRPGHRRLSDESLPHFLERIEADVSKPKNFDHNFIRYEMAISKSEILQWKKDSLDPLMQDVRGWWEGKVPHYMNPNNLISKYGRCQLFLPIVKQEFSQCYRREHAFNELAEL